MGIFNLSPFQIFAGFICLLISLPFHEAAHGFVAYKLGDPTAKNLGRITLNPIKHFDLFGAIAMVFIGIGWAKPVPINPYNFKNPKAGMAISSAAGPLSNILLAYIFMVLYKISFMLFNVIPSDSFLTFFEMFQTLCGYLIFININLAVFNLIPIPPFDGSRIASYFLPERTYFKIMQYEQYIMIVVILIVFSGILDRPLNFLNDIVFTVLDKLTFFIGV